MGKSPELSAGNVVGLRRVGFLSALLLGAMLFSLTQPFVGAAAAHAVTPQVKTPHKGDPKAGTTSHLHAPQLPNTPPFTAKTTPQPIGQLGFPTMAPITQGLDPLNPTHITSSDGMLDIVVPTGAVSAADVSATGGKIELDVTQLTPGSGSSAGGGGIVSFGTYLVKLSDGHGNPVAHGLRKAATFALHYGSKAGAFDLDHAYVIFNGSIPKSAAVGTRGPYATQRATHDRVNKTLNVAWGLDTSLAALPPVKTTTPAPKATATATGHIGALLAPATCTKCYPPTTLTWDTDTYVATFGAPSPLSVDVNAGSLTQGIQIDVPPGPGGTLPNITMAYNSAAVSEQHSPQASASWVGEGWSMSLGEISWAEHNVRQNTGGQQWQDSWQLVDPFGTSSDLIPPSPTISTYYDDTPNNPSVYDEPWHTADEAHIKVYSMNSGLNIGMPLSPPCFRVFEQNGIMEEYGCTADSLQYYYVAGKGDYIANWLLDLVTSPTGNQVQLTYVQDMETISYQGTNYTYPRDAQIATITYDATNCYGSTAATTRCTGSNWNPQYKVNFVASHGPSRLTNTPSGCNTTSNARCDNPLDLANGWGVPEVQTTYVLNDIQVLISANSNWNLLRDYQMKYEVNGPSTITDPVTGLPKSTAGYFDLRGITEVGTDGSTGYPQTTFGYATETEYYTDSTFYPYTTAYCGPTWNQGHGGGSDCSLWSQSYAGNSRYLTSVDNGEGMQQTVSWDLARNNTHGVPTGQSPADPLYCTHTTSPGSYPCDAADDQAWSRMVVVSRTSGVQRLSQAGQGGTQTTTPVVGTYGYTYRLSYPLVAQECGDCVAGMYWGSQNDGDYLDYYNGKFMGFASASVANPDGSVVTHFYEATEGWGVYDTSKVSCSGSNLQPPITTCNKSAWWDLANAAHGRETEADYYDTNGTTLLKTVTTAYSATCPPSGVGGDGSTWDNELVAEVDASNPEAACDVQPTSQTTKVYDGSGAFTQATASYQYDSYGRVTQTTTTSNGGTPGTIVTKTTYVQNDGVYFTPGSTATVSGTYIVDLSAFTDTEDGSGNRATCHYVGYDGLGYQTGQQNGITLGLQTTSDSYTSCGTSPNWTPSGLLRASDKYDNYGNHQASDDPDANNGDNTHTGCPEGSTNYTTCDAYDSRQANQTSHANAKNQANTTGYTNTAAGGWGLWPTSMTDANSNTSSTTYDVLGRTLTTKLPGETSSSTTSKSYTNWCGMTGAQTPCVEEDSTQRLDSSTTVTTRSFYDGYHHLVETRVPAPNNQDVVNYTFYDVMNHTIQSSVKYFVVAYTGAPGSAAFSIPDSTVTATTVNSYDGMGRALSTTDPLSETTTTSYSVVCSPVSGDTGCYEQMLGIDANSHQMGSLADGLGRKGYDQRYTGTNPYTVYSTTSYAYDVLGNVLTTKYPNGSTATATYDGAGRETASTDPDLGSYTYNHDANGNLSISNDPRGTSVGSYYICYDGLNRKVKIITVNNCATTTTATILASYSYDAGTNGKGQMTGEVFNSNGTSGTYTYGFDTRGQKNSWTMAIGPTGGSQTSYAFSFGYNDAGMPLTVTYPGSDTLTAGYTPQGWPSSMLDGSTNLVSNIAYTGIGGANMEPTSASVGLNLYTYNYTYDGLARPTGSSVIRVSDSSTLFSQSRGYDNVGNVISTAMTLPQGTDNQAFCYDEQNRLVWAGATGTPSCGSSLTAGTLTAAQYTQTFSYDTLNRLQTGPVGGSYTYNDTHHLDAVTSAGTGYTAGYDQAGDMSCRAPTSSLTCSGTATGQQMGYDQLRRMAAWQNQATGTTSSATYAYDGEGQRVQQAVASGGTTTTTQYVGGFEEVSITGGTTTTTKYYAAGVTQAISTNGTLSYTAMDGLGSMSASLDGSGNVSADQLFSPYGTTRYTSGTMPTAKAFTGQYQDGSGLAYYNARYYDPTVGQFTSADSVQGNNRFAYVMGNPETNTDPTGQFAGCGHLAEDGMCNPGRQNDPYLNEQPASHPYVPSQQPICGNTDHCPRPHKGKTGSGGPKSSTRSGNTDHSPVKMDPWHCFSNGMCASYSDIIAFATILNGTLAGEFAQLALALLLGIAGIAGSIPLFASGNIVAAKIALGAGIAGLGAASIIFGDSLLGSNKIADIFAISFIAIGTMAVAIGVAIAASGWWDFFLLPKKVIDAASIIYTMALSIASIISIVAFADVIRTKG